MRHMPETMRLDCQMDRADIKYQLVHLTQSNRSQEKWVLSYKSTAKCI